MLGRRTAACNWPAPLNGGERPSLHGVYGLRELEDFSAFLRELWACADVQGVPLEGAIAEYAPGQLELTLKHGPDALRAADEAVMYKRIAKGVAARHGVRGHLHGQALRRSRRQRPAPARQRQ